MTDKNLPISFHCKIVITDEVYKIEHIFSHEVLYASNEKDALKIAKLLDLEYRIRIWNGENFG